MKAPMPDIVDGRPINTATTEGNQRVLCPISPIGCAMFKKLAGHRVEEVDKNNPCCKYFEARPKPAPIVARRKPALNPHELALLSQLRDRAKP
jgi:hypothetical protein